MKLDPLGDRIVVRPEKPAGQTKSGLYLPDNARERPQRGEVLAVGPGRVLDDGGRSEIDLEPGDVVLFRAYAGGEFEMDGEKYLVLGADDVMARVVE